VYTVYPIGVDALSGGIYSRAQFHRPVISTIFAIDKAAVGVVVGGAF
jgi:hypothetical protein